MLVWFNDTQYPAYLKSCEPLVFSSSPCLLAYAHFLVVVSDFNEVFDETYYF